jgi:hypothetical protein
MPDITVGFLGLAGIELFLMYATYQVTNMTIESAENKQLSLVQFIGVSIWMAFLISSFVLLMQGKALVTEI